MTGAAAGSARSPIRRGRGARVRALGPIVYDGTAGVGLFLAQLAAGPASRGAADRGGALRMRDARAAPTGSATGSTPGARGRVGGRPRRGAARRGRAARARAPAPARAASRSPRCPDIVTERPARSALVALAAAFDERALSRTPRRRRAPRRADGHATRGGRGRTPVGAGRTTSAGSRMARAGSAGRCSSCSRPPARRGSAAAPRARSPTSGRGSTSPRAPGRTCASAASAATARLRLADDRHLVPRRGRHRAHALRATALLDPEPVGTRAEIALETTRSHLAARLPYEIDDLSLCHGLGGSADALICAGDSRDASAVELGRRRAPPTRDHSARWP